MCGATRGATRSSGGVMEPQRHAVAPGLRDWFDSSSHYRTPNSRMSDRGGIHRMRIHSESVCCECIEPLEEVN